MRSGGAHGRDADVNGCRSREVVADQSALAALAVALAEPVAALLVEVDRVNGIAVAALDLIPAEATHPHEGLQPPRPLNRPRHLLCAFKFNHLSSIFHFNLPDSLSGVKLIIDSSLPNVKIIIVWLKEKRRKRQTQ